jgi:Domain of unknown function (DUF5671)
MAVSQELIDFVKEGLQRGISRVQIEQALLAAGWNTEQVRGAIGSFAVVDFPIPVPNPRPYLSAREAFMYVVLFTTLYLSAYNLGSLLFELVNRAFPDVAERENLEYARAAIRWSVSSIVVAFPVFLYVAWLIARGVRADPTKRASRIRRQLTYLTLFIAACVLIGDVTTLIFNFLGGELTTRFGLKVLIAAVIAGTGFGYYLSELRADEKEV